MLELKSYSLAELAQVLGGAADRQSIQRKLERKGILYETVGRGSSAVVTIKNIPEPFPLFCMEVLNLQPQTDFKKLRNLFYYCFNDEEFFAMPDERKEYWLKVEGHPISRQSIANYLHKLYSSGLWHEDKVDCVYYFAHGKRYRPADKKEYLNAWHDYWNWKEETQGDLALVSSMIVSKYGGFPRKQPKPIANAIGADVAAELVRLTNESFEKEYDLQN